MDFESCINKLEGKLSIFKYKIGHKGHQRSNLRWLLILNDLYGIYSNYVPSFMFLSRSAQRKCLVQYMIYYMIPTVVTLSILFIPLLLNSLWESDYVLTVLHNLMLKGFSTTVKICYSILQNH